MVLGALSAFGPLSLDLYLPGLPQLADDLGASASAVQLTLTACLLGLAVGQLLSGLWSDAAGRRRPLLIGVAVRAAGRLRPVAGSVQRCLRGQRRRPRRRRAGQLPADCPVRAGSRPRCRPRRGRRRRRSAADRRARPGRLVGILPALFLVVACIGLVFPSGTARALQGSPSPAGSASGLLGLAQFAVGAVSAPLVGVAGRATALPMAVVVATCELAALTAF